MPNRSGEPTTRLHSRETAVQLPLFIKRHRRQEWIPWTELPKQRIVWGIWGPNLSISPMSARQMELLQ